MVTQIKVQNHLKGLPLTYGVFARFLKQLLIHYKLLDKHKCGATAILCNKTLIWLLIHSAGTMMGEYRLV